jgi:ATP phosphoribosyltransferase
MYDNVASLFADAGLPFTLHERTYRPIIGSPWLEAKIMKPQNVGELLELGSHDAGFTGSDWIAESGARVEEVLDLGFDRVSIVAAIPDDADEIAMKDRRIVAATEYVHIAERYLTGAGYNFRLLRTYGATEVFPPDDSDMIIDNTATGQTLRENNLKVIATIMQSSTRFFASEAALKSHEKREHIEELAMLFRAVLEGRERVMLEMNVSAEKYHALLRDLPAMRSPTVSPLYSENDNEKGFAVKAAVPKRQVAALIPRLKKLGATDIVEYGLRSVVP